MNALAIEAEEGRFKPAKVIGEVVKTVNPMVSEWGNPPISNNRDSDLSEGEPPELKYLSRERKRNRMRGPE